MSKELGTLVVVILKAKNLHDRHSFYKQDPFTQITLDGVTHKTEPDVKGGQHPEWDQEFRFIVDRDEDEKHRMMEITCLRKEPRKEEEIGKGKLDITKTLKTGEFDDWIPIEDTGGVYRGEIYLEMTFFAAGPAPLARRPSKLRPTERLTHLNQPSGPSGQFLKPNPSPPGSEAPLPAIPEIVNPAPVPNILRAGQRGSGPTANSASGANPRLSQSPPRSPPRATAYVPASLAPGHPQSAQANRKTSVPFSEPPAQPAYQAPLPFAEPSALNGVSSRPQPQRDHSSSTNYNYDYQSHPTPRHEQSLPPSNGHGSPTRSHFAEASSFFPTPQIVVADTPSNYPSYTAPPQAQPPHFQPPQAQPPPFQPPPQAQPPPFSPPPQVQPSPFSPPPQVQPSPFSPPPQAQHPAFQPPPQQPAFRPPPQAQYPAFQPPSFQASAFQQTPQPYNPGYPPASHPPLNASYRNATPVSQLPYQYNHHPPPPSHTPSYEDDFPDPHLISRYNSPLPLPPGQQRHNNYKPPPSLPPSKQVAPPVAIPTVDPRAEAQRREEEALKREKEQEEKDLALARQLDMELNL